MKIYHNPRCSKSRQTLAILEEAGVPLEVVEYLKTPPTAAELDRICTALGVEPQEIVRRGEARFHELGLDARDGASRDEWLTLLAENPILIERPIVVKGSRAVLGRPPERARDLLG